MNEFLKMGDDYREAEFEERSGNVFADLGLGDADGRLARARIGFHVHKILTAKKLKQREIASLVLANMT